MTSNSPSSQNQPSFIVTYDDILGTIPSPDQEAFLHLLIETQQNILACPRLMRSYAISSLPEDPSDESQAIQTRMMEVHRYLRESPPNIHVEKGDEYAQVKHDSEINSNGVLYRFNDCYIGAARQEMKWEIHIDQELFKNWIALKKTEIEGIISTYKSRKLQYVFHFFHFSLSTNWHLFCFSLTTFIIKVVLVHEVAHIVHATFSDGPSISSEEFCGQNVGISAEVALTDDQGEVVAVFEEWTGIHHLALAGKHNEHYITRECGGRVVHCED
jgi:hypothetical protein